ncbi:unnamed protein product [Cylindrotheca closterium]|uniref:Uncharacterized protein n=1 Tax=Cylindrotheca closterium TaxID=2856 RepID=A0AAD2G323_9STRA|nr:unnamed protein product [Cylindrotheca closterium]
MLFEQKTEFMSDSQKGNVRVGTAELLEMLRAEEPESDFSFCLGADTFADLTSLKWKRSLDVLRLLEGRLVVFSRKGSNAITKEQIELLNQRQHIDAKLLEVNTLTDVSSSMIRACKDDKILRTSLSPSVLEYMKEHRLFAFAPQSSDID